MAAPKLQGTNQHGLASIHGRPRAAKMYRVQENFKHAFRSRGNPRSPFAPKEEVVNETPNSEVKSNPT